MTTMRELDEAIDAIEKQVLKRYVKGGNAVRLSPHRWAQMLRLLKFARLRWETLHDDPAWDWRTDHPRSPYYIRGKDYTELRQYRKENPDFVGRTVEPPPEIER
jgi:hypothetical protein